jgi:thiol-disulfide isomerase/thioredoxin
MWRYKLITHWSKRDYIEFSIFIWILIFCIVAVLSVVQSRPLELSQIAVFSLVMIPVELVIIFIFHKYSSSISGMSEFPSLLPTDFNGNQLSKSGRILVFLYAEWCPFSRNAFHNLDSLRPSSCKIFRIDLSDEDNPLWNSLKIRRIPTLIVFDDGKELWRKEATYMIGLRKTDFNEANSLLNPKLGA